MTASQVPNCLILGGGGHARVLIDCLQTGGEQLTLGILDSDRSLWGKKLLGVPVLGGDDLLPHLATQGTTHFVVGLGGIADNNPRKQLFELGREHGLIPLTVKHPRSICSDWAKIGDGTVIFPAAVVNAGAVLGVNTIVNTGAIIEHDCVLGDHVHLATGTRLCSTVQIGPGAHVGAGATVRQSLSIGEGAVIGAGAAVVRDVDPWTVVAGVPARVLKHISSVSTGSDVPAQRVSP